jgi:signal transduction histidine kinase/putative methionine-R-sulfoxide reductase with GAF domain
MNETVDKLEMLVTVARLLSSRLDISELLTTIMRLATRVVNSERASLYLLDKGTQELYFDVALYLDENLKKIRLKLGEGIAGLCAKEGKSIISNNLDKDRRHTKKIDNKSGYVTKSLLTCPMIIKGRVIGVVQAINKIDGEFDENDKENFEAFASQAAIAIENSRLFNSLKEEKGKLDYIFKTIKEIVVLTDESGKIELANKSAENYLGYNKNKHTNIRELLSDFSSNNSLDNVINISGEEEKVFLFERDVPKKLILECRVKKNTVKERNSSEKTEILWIFDDVTQRILEEKISREFLSLVSHKIKTPLTAIIGYSDLLKSKSDDKNLIEKAVASISSQAFKLNSLISKMLDFTMIDNKSVSDINLTDIEIKKLVEEIIADLKEEYKNVEFKTAVIDDFNLRADRDLIKKAIVEIIDNGIKFNDKDKKEIIITAKKLKEGNSISIWDNGKGIPQNEIEKIFERFYQIESSFTGQTEGWGLGLSKVKKIIDLHNAYVKIKSHLGKDTMFTIVLP